MEILKMKAELPHAPPSPKRRLDILFYSAPSSPRSSPSFLLPDPLSPADAGEDFEFDFSGHLDITALSAADELFLGGKILPLKPPPAAASGSPKSPVISKLRGAMSPKRDKPNPDFDPARGRARKPNPRLGPGRGVSRSLSPLRVSEFALQQQQQQEKNNSSSSLRGYYKKWRFKDLLLFRSASEGSRPLKKYPAVATESTRFYGDDHPKISSSRSASFRAPVGEGSSRRRSPHEIHYAANRAVSEDLKKKTSLPYKYGLLGCLGFNLSSSSSSPGFREFSRGLGYSFSR